MDVCHKGQVVQSFDGLFNVILNKLLNCGIASDLRWPPLLELTAFVAYNVLSWEADIIVEFDTYLIE